MKVLERIDIICRGDLLSYREKGCGAQITLSLESIKETEVCGVYLKYVECPKCGYCTVFPDKD